LGVGFGGKKAKRKAKKKSVFYIAVKGFQSLRDGYAALDGGRIVVLKAGNESSGIFDFGLVLYMFTFSFHVEVLKSICTIIRGYEFIT